MTTPEQALLDRLLERIDKLVQSAAIDLHLMGEVPDAAGSFENMPPARQSASRALLKSFEQIEDQLARTFRAIPALVGTDTERWFARDFADFMERAGVLDDAAEWSRVVRLRNQLVHDYPLDPDVQIARLREVVERLPYLEQTYRRLATFVRDDLPGKML